MSTHFELMRYLIHVQFSYIRKKRQKFAPYQKLFSTIEIVYSSVTP
jgi:hypothetical protein